MTQANRNSSWAAVVARDRMADGKFYYSVKTTGVYCRPSCAARLARPENVDFHETRSEAEKAGFRACKRCKPERLDTKIQFAIGECSWASILVARSERGVCAVLPGSDRDSLIWDLWERFPGAHLIEDSREMMPLVRRVVRHVERPASGFDLELDLRGTDFQRRVWEALLEVPVGRTASYAEIAQKIGSPQSVRAVAQACGANALAIVVPCHRVLRSDGSLSGYRWGIERKRALLEREAVA